MAVVVGVWNKKHILKVLKGDVKELLGALIWSNSPQGSDYWRERYRGNQKLTQEDREYLFSLLFEKTSLLFEKTCNYGC